MCIFFVTLFQQGYRIVCRLREVPAFGEIRSASQKKFSDERKTLILARQTLFTPRVPRGVIALNFFFRCFYLFTRETDFAVRERSLVV